MQPLLSDHFMSFTTLGLAELILRAVDEQGYTEPSPIQAQAIPAVLSGHDVMAAAQTGTGKTASFTLPLLQRLVGGPRVQANHIRALVLTPTRELAVQVAESIATYGKYLPLKSGVVYGGVKINPQMMRLGGGLDVLVATPGRLLDLFSQNAVKFTQVETLVLDEADRMLDLGFSDEIGRILSFLPEKRQNLLFSATFSSDIRTLADNLLKNPKKIEVSPRNSAADNVRQRIYEVDKKIKPALLSHLVRTKNWQQVLVFTRTKKGADQLVLLLERDGISTVSIHGDKKQNERTRALEKFKANRVRVLVATDVASRGLDISELPRVVNFDLPKVAQDYIHRIGRTGRAGSPGEGDSLVSADEVKLLAAIEELIRQTLSREREVGFVPTQPVPSTRLTRTRPKKPKKTKQAEARVRARPAGGKKKAAGKKPRRASASENTDRPNKGSAEKSKKKRDSHKPTTKARRGAARQNDVGKFR
jgi:ATP-dependent RNA helicase RhlE